MDCEIEARLGLDGSVTITSAPGFLSCLREVNPDEPFSLSGENVQDLRRAATAITEVLYGVQDAIDRGVTAPWSCGVKLAPVEGAAA